MMKPTHRTITIAGLTIWAAAGLATPAYASNVYYNTSQTYASNIGTDNNGGQDGMAGDQNDSYPYIPTTTFAGWNAASSPLPFGFNNLRLNWAAEITARGDALTVSSQDAFDRYGIWADIDTAKGAWFDNTSGNGWEHQTDVGLIKTSVDTEVTINISSYGNSVDGGNWTNFGVSVYSGMPEGDWIMHSAWNWHNSPVPFFEDFTGDSPFTEGGTTYITHNGTVDNVNGITFTATAGTVYTILLGGNSGQGQLTPKQGYALSISTAPVPVPGAVWLFGSALLGMIGVRRNVI